MSDFKPVLPSKLRGRAVGWKSSFWCFKSAPKHRFSYLFQTLSHLQRDLKAFFVTHLLHTFQLASPPARLYRFYSESVCETPVLPDNSWLMMDEEVKLYGMKEAVNCRQKGASVTLEINLILNHFRII